MITLFFPIAQIATQPVSTDYVSIGIQLLFAIGFVSFMLFVSSKVGPKRLSEDKLQTFSSGIAHHGDARQPMAIKYFLVAILFVLFDVEIVLFYPYAAVFKTLGWAGFSAIFMFVGFFLIGFFYIIKKGALEWEE